MSHIKCVIFDCEGTLIDSERLCCQAIVNVFEQFDVALTMQECLQHFQGGKLADILNTTQQRLGLSISLDILEPMYRENVSYLFQKYLLPMPGAFELLDYLKAQKIEYCIASNGPKDKIEKALSLTGLLTNFDGRIFSGFEANSWKPDPDLILYSIMNMGFLPSECLYIDDTPMGVEAGVNAGVKTLHYCYDMQEIPNLFEQVTPIKHLDDIAQFL